MEYNILDLIQYCKAQGYRIEVKKEPPDTKFLIFLPNNPPIMWIAKSKKDKISSKYIISLIKSLTMTNNKSNNKRR